MAEFNTNDRAENILSPRGLWGVLARRKSLAAGTFLVLLAAAATLILTLPEQYEASLQLMVKRARADKPVDVDRGQAAVVSSDVTAGEIASEIELFRNRASLEDTVVSCGLVNEIGNPPAGRRARIALAVRELDRNLAVYRIENTNLIAARYTHRDPQRAAGVLRRLADNYLAKHLEVHRNRDTSEFFRAQAADYEKQLTQAQKALASFRARHRISLLADEKQATLRRQSELERTLQETNSQIQDARERIARLRAQLDKLPETIETSSRQARNEALVERLKTTLLELENKRTELLTKYDAGYRLVREVEQQIRDTRKMLDQATQAQVVDRTRALNPLRQKIEGSLLETETELSGLGAKRDATARDLERVRTELAKLDRLTAEHDNLTRNVKLAEDNYVLYKRKLAESRMEDAMDRQRILNVSVVQDVEPPAVPTEQHRALLLILGAIMACFATLAVAFTAEMAAPLFRPAADGDEELVERGVVDVVSAGERVGSPGPEKERPEREEAPGRPFEPGYQQGRVYAQPAAHPEPAGGDAPPTELVLFPPGPVAGPGARTPGVVEIMSRELALRDDYGQLIDYMGAVRGSKHGVSIGLAPGINPEEAAVAAVQLACSLERRNGLPVLLVDAGGRGRSLAELFGLAKAKGVHELLGGPAGSEKECIHRTRFGNLWLLPAGKRHGNADAPPARVEALYKALANGSMNLIVYLPEAADGKVSLMMYSILDAVLANLKEEDARGADPEELVRRVIEAKRKYSERRLTLVGGAKQWSNDEAESLTVC